MSALLSTDSKGLAGLVIGRCAVPEPRAGQVRIKVAACAINYPDVLIIEDRYQFMPERPFAPGAEVAGVIEAIGPGVTAFKAGDRVLAGGLCGGLADQAVMDAANCFAIPPQMPDEDAAAFLMTYGTAHHALQDRARIAPGETLLVLGAAGGVGLATVELGRWMGASVIAAVSSHDKAAVAAQRGAHETIVYPAGPMDRAALKGFTEAIRVAAGGDVDVVLDAVGGQYSEPALRALGWNGRFLVVGFPAGIARIPLNLPLLKCCAVIGVFWGSFIAHFPEQHRRNVAELLDWYGQGGLRPLVSAVYPFERAAEAIADLAERRAIGKVVVRVS